MEADGAKLSSKRNVKALCVKALKNSAKTLKNKPQMKETAMQTESQVFLPQLMLTYDIRRNCPLAIFKALIAADICAAILLYDSDEKADEAALQEKAEILVPLIQAQGLPALLAADSRICGRVKADGFHLEEHNPTNTAELIALRKKYGNTYVLGYGNPHSRHTALEAGECDIDYIFFGKLGKDKKPKPHTRNIVLASWWAEIMQPNSIVQAGADIENLQICLETKADFIAVEEMVFAAAEPLKALTEIQKRLVKWRK